MRLDDLPEPRADQWIIGLPLALLSLVAIVWVLREVTGQRDSPSVPAMLERALREHWPAWLAFWRWSRLLLALFSRAARETYSASADSPAHPRQLR